MISDLGLYWRWTHNKVLTPDLPNICPTQFSPPLSPTRGCLCSSNHLFLCGLSSVPLPQYIPQWISTRMQLLFLCQVCLSLPSLFGKFLLCPKSFPLLAYLPQAPSIYAVHQEHRRGLFLPLLLTPELSYKITANMVCWESQGLRGISNGCTFICVCAGSFPALQSEGLLCICKADSCCSDLNSNVTSPMPRCRQLHITNSLSSPR